MAVVYFLKSSHKNWVYVGSTHDLDKRVTQHNRGEVRSTRWHRPLQLIYQEVYGSLHQARLREKQIKSVRKIKEEILKNLALSSNG